MDDWTCAKSCNEVTWQHVRLQALVAAGPWLVMTAGSTVFAACAPQSASANRPRFAAYELGLASKSKASAFAVLTVHAMQCSTFLFRSMNRSVDSIYFALEMLGTILIVIDVLAGWAFVTTRGVVAVLVGSVKRLMVDCLVMTAALGVMAEDPQRGRTWFSFSYLASARMLRIVNDMLKTDEASSRASWRKQILYNLLIMTLFTYLAAASVMVAEILATPSAVADRWDLNAGLLFAFSTVLTEGNVSRTPQTVFGRLFTVGFLCWVLYNMVMRIVPLLHESFAGMKGRGRYRQSRWRNRSHLLIVGTPSASMVWEFLQEIYHENHYESEELFDKTADDAVLLIESQRTLRQLQKMLRHKSGIRFRDKVVLLQGEAYKAEDLRRANLQGARRAFVLPDLGVENAQTEDAANVMRTFAICRSAPHVHVVCLFHSADYHASTLTASTGNSSFLSVSATKLSLMGMACLTRGSLALVSNLCSTSGAQHLFEEKPWQWDYEHSVGVEMYELPLSPVYHGLQFGDVAEDVLMRSDDGAVYLIGLSFADTVVIHPGANYVLDCLNGKVGGVFMAQDLSAIRQSSDGRLLFGSKFDYSQPVSRFSGVSYAGGTRSSTLKGARASRRASRESHGRDSEASSFSQSPKSPDRAAVSQQLVAAARGEAPQQQQQQQRASATALAGLGTEQKSLAALGYKESMDSIRHQLLLSANLGLDVIAGITLPQKVKKGEAEEARAKSEPPPGSAQAMLGASRLRHGEKHKFEDLRRLHALYARAERDALSPPGPSQSVLEAGGHLLLCLVGCSVDDLADKASARSIAIEHFMRPLRDSYLPTEQVKRPAVVVLAECLPSDWYKVLEYERVYYVCGSPLRLTDLERAVFKKANAIAILDGSRSAEGTAGGNASAADVRVVLAANMIEKHLPHDSQTLVITDHTFKGSCEFLPTMKVNVERPEEFADVAMGRTKDMSEALGELAQGAFGRREGIRELLNAPCTEDFQDVGSSDYVHHPRYMRGQVFVSSVITGLVANSLYNVSLLPLVDALMRAPMLLLPLPSAWERRSYKEFCTWLMQDRNLLALGLFRSALAAEADKLGKPVDETQPTHHFMFTAPPAWSTMVIRTDKVLCVAPAAMPQR